MTQEAEARLKCFLHYGSEDRTYIPKSEIRIAFQPEKLKSVIELLGNEEAARNIVPTIVKVFRGGYSVEPSAALFALAMVVRNAKKNYSVANEAYKAVRKLSEENGEYFLIFTCYLRQIAKTQNKKGFGKGWRMSVLKLYEKKDGMELAQMVTRAPAVMKWSHRDVYALSRLRAPLDPAKAAVTCYLRKGWNVASMMYGAAPEAKPVLEFLKNVNRIRSTKLESTLINLITMHEFSMEYVPSGFFTKRDVWMALIPRMSIETLLSNIIRMAKLKIFRHDDVVAEIHKRFRYSESADVNIHPINVYILKNDYEFGPNLALDFQYQQRRRAVENSREGNEDPIDVDQQVQRQPPPRRNPQIVESLWILFNKSLTGLAPTGQRYLIALDSQKTMETRKCYKKRFVTAEEAASLVALCVIKAESEMNVKLVTFTKEECGIKEFHINKARETLETLKGKINLIDSAPASLPQLINWAISKEEEFDVIILLGDNTLVAQGAHEALKIYKEQVYPTARVITCSFTGPHKKCKDLTKSDMFLICGFDKNVGRLIEAYSRGAF